VADPNGAATSQQTAELIRKVKRIHIASRRAVDSMMAGSYRSVFRGSGVEFEEVREYSPGDEVKAIDWKVTARMGRPYVKLYREERELSVMLLVDMSRSGLFGAGDSLKRNAAVELASVLAFNAIRNNDKVGALLFTDRVERYIPPKKGSAHVWRVLRELLAFEPEGKGTDVAAALDFMGKVTRKRSVAFLISDFLAEGYLQSLKRANRRHDCIAVAVTDPGDFALPPAGLLEAEDPETGERFLLDCSDRRTREVYAAERRRFLDETLGGFKRARIDCIELSTQASAVDALQGFFRYRERRAR